MSDKGLLVVVSGFSGAGKGTVMKRLLELHGDEYALSISATTRTPRAGEIDGVSYFFKTRKEFEDMIANDQLIEHAQYNENYYGTPKKYVEDSLNDGKNVVLEIEVQGAMNIKNMYKDAVLMFIMPPSAKELEKRLRGRGTEAEEVIEQRLSIASKEAEYSDRYDYIIINDVVDDCVDRITEVVLSEKQKSVNNIEKINEMKEQLKCYSKGDN